MNNNKKNPSTWKATLRLEESHHCRFSALFQNEAGSLLFGTWGPKLTCTHQWPRNTRNTPTPASWHRFLILISHHRCHSGCFALSLALKSCWWASFCQLASTGCLFPRRKVGVYREKREEFWNISPDALTWTTCDPHRRRDESASGRGLLAKKKMAQPGTGAQAMDKSVSNFTCSRRWSWQRRESLKQHWRPPKPGYLKAAAARAADCRSFDVSYCCRKWRWVSEP